jgi:hypothetical protein
MGLLAGSPNASGSSSVKTRNVYANSVDRTPDATTLARLQANIQSGKPIRYDDINDLMTLFNNYNGHYHTWTDLYESGDAANYGGFGDGNYSRPGNLTVSRNSSGQSMPALSFYSSTQIHHYDQNNLSNTANGWINHSHATVDRNAS